MSKRDPELFVDKSEKITTTVLTAGEGVSVSPMTKPLPTRCRVKLVDGLRVPIVGGNSAFDAEFDWATMTARGYVDSHLVVVGIQQCVIAFHK
jgi:hypothetical protein